MAPPRSPQPFLMARSMLSLGMFWAFAARMAERRRGFMSGLVPPSLVAMVISLENLLKTAPRLESTTALRRLILDHLLWPAI